MPNRLHQPQKLIAKKERPFNDEDTRIQIREDFAHFYVRDPLWRHALEEPLIRMGITSPALLDMESADEDDDVGVRTRERHLPQMPLHQEFLEGMTTAQDPLMTRDLELTLRHYNDAIRWDSEFARVFVLGLLRQLRQWTQSQTPDVQPESAEALCWVRDVLLPRLSTDMSILDAYLTPEQDLEEMRRWVYEADNLSREIEIRLQMRDEHPSESNLTLDSAPESIDDDQSMLDFEELQQDRNTVQEISSVQNEDLKENRPWLKFLINTTEGTDLKKADPERAEELCSVIDNLANEGHLSKGELDLAHKLQLVFNMGESINIPALQDYDAFDGLTDQIDAELLSQQEQLARVIRSNIATEEEDLEESFEEESAEGELVDEAPSEDDE